MNKLKISILISQIVLTVGVLFTFAAAPAIASAGTPLTNFAKTAAECKGGSFFNLPTWYKYLTFTDECIVDTSTGNVSFLVMLAIADILLYVAGLLAVVFVIYGGFSFVVAQAEPGKIASARKTILNALIGLVIAIFASQLVNFIASRIT